MTYILDGDKVSKGHSKDIFSGQSDDGFYRYSGDANLEVAVLPENFDAPRENEFNVGMVDADMPGKKELEHGRYLFKLHGTVDTNGRIVFVDKTGLYEVEVEIRKREGHD